MDNEQLIIEGYNKEKVILVDRLSCLPTCNATIATRGSIERRLKDIDNQILKNIHKDK